MKMLVGISFTLCSLLIAISAFPLPPTYLDSPTLVKLGANQTFIDDFDTFSWYGNGGTWQTWLGANPIDSVWGRTEEGNDELEYYSDQSTGVNPFSIENSTLIITANKCSNCPKNPNGLQLLYTSGVICTYPTYTQRLGYFEMRAQLPWGKGFWPAFWMLPEDNSWPPELDALEAFGASNSRGEGYNNEYHYGCISKTSGAGCGEWVATPGDVNITSGFHSYGVMWTPETLTYYFDGKQTAQCKTPPDFVKPMYLIANLAVGGSWPESPNATTPFPATLKIDHIKAWDLTGILY